jgi:autotransporter-associated beta strand protein
MTDPLPNTSRNVSTVSSNLAREPRFNGTGIVSVTASAGTGSLIADEWVLTARHVIAGATNGTFFLEGATRAIAEFHTRDDSDVALVKLASAVTNYPATPIYQGSSEIGKDVWLVGYGRHGQFTGNPNELTPAFQGRYAAMNRVGYATNLGGAIGICLQFSYDGTNAGALPYEGATAPGDSGGPMFMEENGRLWVIGETFGVAPPAPGFYHGRVSAYKDWIRATTGINFNEANWDADPATPGIQNGAGTWGGVSSNWYFGRSNFPWAVGYDVVFGAGTNPVGVVTLATNTSAGDVTFASNSAVQSLGGTNTLNLKSGSVVSNASTVVISAPLAGGAFTKAGAGTLTLSNTAYAGSLVVSGPLVLDESGQRSWNGAISGANNWFKAGGGTVTLAASNSFTGFLTINAGAVRVAHASALGSATGSVVSGGNAVASLEIEGGITVADQIQLVMHNQTNSPHAQIWNVSGSNTIAGHILLNSGGARWDIGSAAGRLSIARGISNISPGTATWRTLHLHGPGAGRINGGMTDNATGTDKLNVTIVSGDWTLGGSNKAYTGNTTVGTGAILRIQTSLASPVVVQNGAVIATAVTNWTSIPAASWAAALTATNGTRWQVRLETTELTNFSETAKIVPVLSVTGGLTNIDPAHIEVEKPGFPGAGTWSAVTNANTLSLSYTPDGYAAWVQSFAWGTNSSAPAANPDGDTLDNFEEYALGGNPLDAVSDPVPVGGTTSDGRFLKLTFHRERSDVTYTVQACNQLTSGWSNVMVNPGSIGADVSYTDTVEISSQGTRFLRLHLSR